MAGLTKSTMVVLVVVMMVASCQLQSTVAQTRHVVGDTLGWTIPPNGAATYTTWASQKTFTVGDTLVFNFTNGLHNVAEVPSAAYDSCTTTNTLSLKSTGPATVTLTRPGTHYYICTAISHCQLGQKLTINVSKVITTANTPDQSAIPLSPPSTIATAPSAFELAPSGSLIPPSLSSSPSFAAEVPVTLLAVALAFFH
ncbi:stellacyanin-like [Bidens hawaiensis]|uniref:stellacyanin-like n=1 Tax=Bidens hawaiensis TaxID=980011 RepID=UPI0040499A2A